MVSLVYSTRRGDITDLEAIAKLESTPETTPWLGETGLEWHRRGFADPDREHLLIESPAAVIHEREGGHAGRRLTEVLRPHDGREE